MRLVQLTFLCIIFLTSAGWVPAQAESPSVNWAEFKPEAKLDSKRTVEPQWKLLGSSNTVFVYINRSPASRDGRYLKAWSLWTYNEQRTTRSGVSYNSTKFLNLIDCKVRTFAVRQVVHYLNVAGLGSPADSFNTPNNELEFIDPVPDSMGEMILESICGKPKLE